MSWETIGWAKEQTQLAPGPRYLLLLLALRCDDEHSCYPGQARLAEESGKGLRTVRRYMGDLEADGFIGRVHRYDQNGKRSSDRTILAVGKGRIGADAHEAAIIVGPGGNTIAERVPVDATEDYRPDWPVVESGVSGHSEDTRHAVLPATSDSDTPVLPATAWPPNTQVLNTQITTSADAVGASGTDTDKPPRQRRPDRVFDLLLELCDGSGGLTRSEHGRYSKAAKDLRDLAAQVGASEDQLLDGMRGRAETYRRKLRGTALTPTALVANWRLCGPTATPTERFTQ